jgi:hypothetical protein
MDLPTRVTYDFMPDGGARVTFANDRVSVSVPFDHDQALNAAASILAAARVRGAAFAGDGDGRGTIREAAQS